MVICSGVDASRASTAAQCAAQSATPSFQASDVSKAIWGDTHRVTRSASGNVSVRWTCGQLSVTICVGNQRSARDEEDGLEVEAEGALVLTTVLEPYRHNFGLPVQRWNE